MWNVIYAHKYICERKSNVTVSQKMIDFNTCEEVEFLVLCNGIWFNAIYILFCLASIYNFIINKLDEY